MLMATRDPIRTTIPSRIRRGLSRNGRRSTGAAVSGGLRGGKGGRLSATGDMGDSAASRQPAALDRRGAAVRWGDFRRLETWGIPPSAVSRQLLTAES